MLVMENVSSVSRTQNANTEHKTQTLLISGLIWKYDTIEIEWVFSKRENEFEA